MFVARRLRALAGVVFLAVVLGVISPGAVAQDSIDDLRDQRETSRRDAADAAAQLDALSAEDLELVEALDALDAHIALQETKIAAAARSIEAAEAEAAAAQLDAEALADEIEAIRDRLRQRAIDAYVAPAEDALDQLNSDDLIGSALRREYLDDIVGDQYAIVDQLRFAISEQDAANRAAEQLRSEAEAERIELDARLADLESARADAEALRLEVQDRIAEWQVRTDEIAEADRLLGEEIRRLEEEARLAAEAEARRQAEEEARRLAEEEAARQAEENADDDPADETEADETGADETEADETDEDPADDSADPPETGSFTITHRPAAGPLTSPFGPRVHPIFGSVRMHNGIDLSGSTGDAILSANDGVVLSVGWRTGYGNTIVVSHGGGYTTLYAHLSAVNVVTGQSVAGGELIGSLGSTGWSTGPHLHFEVRVNGTALDPEDFYPF
ncbi:MAG: peptidoglycan DD-metalloendopeptidase family protein [Actinomycetota bacterium]